MPITFKLQSQNNIVSKDVVFSTVQIEQSQFVTLPGNVQAGPRLIISSVEKKNLAPYEENKKQESE